MTADMTTDRAALVARIEAMIAQAEEAIEEPFTEKCGSLEGWQGRSQALRDILSLLTAEPAPPADRPCQCGHEQRDHVKVGKKSACRLCACGTFEVAADRSDTLEEQLREQAAKGNGDLYAEAADTIAALRAALELANENTAYWREQADKSHKHEADRPDTPPLEERLAELLQTGGMTDPSFLYGQVLALLDIITALRAELESVKQDAADITRTSNTNYAEVQVQRARAEAAETALEAATQLAQDRCITIEETQKTLREYMAESLKRRNY